MEPSSGKARIALTKEAIDAAANDEHLRTAVTSLRNLPPINLQVLALNFICSVTSLVPIELRAIRPSGMAAMKLLPYLCCFALRANSFLHVQVCLLMVVSTRQRHSFDRW